MKKRQIFRAEEFHITKQMLIVTSFHRLQHGVGGGDGKE